MEYTSISSTASNEGFGVQSELVEMPASERVVIKAQAEGNGWRSESLIVQLSSFLAFKDFREEMICRGMTDVVAREGGGRLVLLTFPSAQLMHEGKRELQGWGEKWCDSINEWKESQFFEQEMCVWLHCFGILINLWSTTTIRSIGSYWGEVVQFEEDVNNPLTFQQTKVRIITRCLEWINTTVVLDHKGCQIPVKVCEELPRCLIPSPSQSNGIDHGWLQSKGIEEEDQLEGLVSDGFEGASRIANEEMDRTLRCFEPVQLHQSGEAPSRRHDEPKRPTTYLRMRADNAPLPRRRTNRSYNEQEDGIKTCASSKKPNTSTAAPLYKELKKDDYYWVIPHNMVAGSGAMKNENEIPAVCQRSQK
ncbi:unnamed protein product [Camellia sinensis]